MILQTTPLSNCHTLHSVLGNSRKQLAFTLNILIFFFFFFLERERVHMSGGGAEREGERESQAGSALLALSPIWGLNSRTVRS